MLQNTFFRIWLIIHQSPGWVIQLWQHYRVWRITRFARVHNPFTKKRYQVAADASTIKRARLLKTMRRNDLIDVPESEYVTPHLPASLYAQSGYTAGATGQPIRFIKTQYAPTDAKLEQKYFAAKQWRCLLWEGYSVDDITSLNIVELKEGTDSTHRLFLGIDEVRADPAAAVAKLKAFAPTVLAGYTTYVAELAQLWATSETESISIPYTIVGGQPLKPEGEAAVIDTFATTFFSRYSLEEFRSVAIESRDRNGLHIHVESYLVEILNELDQPVPNGTTGRIVITDLYNRAMPFIRYDTGDYGYLKTVPSAVGPQSPRLFIEPRPEFEITSGQTVISRADVNRFLGKYFRAILQYQIIQTSETAITIALIAGPAYQDAYQREIEQHFTQLLSEHSVIIDMVSTLPERDGEKTPLFVDKTT